MESYRVPEMSCGHCSKAIEAAVRRIDPLAEIKIDLGTKQVEVNSKQPPIEIVQAIRQAGYEVQHPAG